MGAAIGFAADRNEIQNPSWQNPCTVTSNCGWSTTAPLPALMTTPVTDYAVSADFSTIADPATGGLTAAHPLWVQFDFATPIDFSFFGLFETNAEQSAVFRVEAWFDAGRTDLVGTTTTVDGRDRSVVPPLTDPASMRAGAPNQMRGDLDRRDFLLLPTNIAAFFPLCRARVIRFSFWGDTYKADGTSDTVLKIGFAWAGDGLFFTRHVNSGAGVKSNDERIETPGGNVWVEPGITKRTTTIDRSVTDKSLRDELFKMALRTGKGKPMVYMPDIDDLAECFLYGGLWRRADDHVHKYMAARHTNTSMELEEFKE